MTEVSPEDAAAQRAAEQARIRKERREAKIKAGGSARLNKITGLGGRAPEAETPSRTSPAPSTSSNATPAKGTKGGEHADPDEVDISEHFYQPSSSGIRPATSATPPIDPNALSETQRNQMMLGFDRLAPAPGQAGPPGAQANNPFASVAAAAGVDPENDPLMKMLSQVMANGGGGGGGDGQGFPGMAFPGMPGQEGLATAPKQASSADYIWRVIHAIFALTLGIYIASTTGFSGSKTQRERTALSMANATPEMDDAAEEAHAIEHGREVFFWMFATVEALLVATRFVIEKGRPSREAGLLWTVAGFLPGPWRGRTETVLRYGQVLSGVRRDILVCVFVLGVASWVRAS